MGPDATLATPGPSALEGVLLARQPADNRLGYLAYKAETVFGPGAGSSPTSSLRRKLRAGLRPRPFLSRSEANDLRHVRSCNLICDKTEIGMERFRGSRNSF